MAEDGTALMHDWMNSSVNRHTYDQWHTVREEPLVLTPSAARDWSLKMPLPPCTTAAASSPGKWPGAVRVCALCFNKTTERLDPGDPAVVELDLATMLRHACMASPGAGR